MTDDRNVLPKMLLQMPGQGWFLPEPVPPAIPMRIVLISPNPPLLFLWGGTKPPVLFRYYNKAFPSKARADDQLREISQNFGTSLDAMGKADIM